MHLHLLRYYAGNSLSVLYDSFTIAKAPEVAKHIKEFIMPQQVSGVARFAKLSLINDKGFVYDHASRAQSIFYLWYE